MLTPNHDICQKVKSNMNFCFFFLNFEIGGKNISHPASLTVQISKIMCSPAPSSPQRSNCGPQAQLAGDLGRYMIGCSPNPTLSITVINRSPPSRISSPYRAPPAPHPHNAGGPTKALPIAICSYECQFHCFQIELEIIDCLKLL